jgi:hypothetical protein
VLPEYPERNNMRFLKLFSNALTANGLSANGLASGNDLGAKDFIANGWNALFVPNRFSEMEIGSNWIDANLLGPEGVGDLVKIPTIQNNILDNRHIHDELKMMLCNQDSELKFREYFSALIEMAWPINAELWVCCSDPADANAVATTCLEPDYTFSSKPKVEGVEPLVFAPHFLTEKFDAEQQEALTAALIAKFNVLGKHLIMDLRGRFDLGHGKHITAHLIHVVNVTTSKISSSCFSLSFSIMTAGSKFIADSEPGFDYYLGNAWGNAFLDCFGDDKDHVLCQASTEVDRPIGRDSQFFGLPMFTCSGGSTYPTRESGKACFSKDMETNEEDGCDLVASVGLCDHVCFAGFCGVNDPPLEHRGATNVLYVYMKEYDDGKGQVNSDLILKIGIPVFVVLTVAALMLWKFSIMRKSGVATSSSSDVAAAGVTTGKQDDEETVVTGIGSAELAA